MKIDRFRRRCTPRIASLRSNRLSSINRLTASFVMFLGVMGMAAMAAVARGEPSFGAVLWQPLPPTVQQVRVGADGRVWQVSPPVDPLATAASLQKAVEEEFHKPAPHVRGATPILFEPGGRVWFAGWGFKTPMISGYDGKTWIHRPLQHEHLQIGRGVGIGEHLFFCDTRGIDCFDGRTWAYHRLMKPGPGPITPVEPPIVQLQPDGKGLLAVMRSGTTSALWRWRGEWTELPSPGNLTGLALRFVPAADGIWFFSEPHGLFFQPFDPATTAPALLKLAVSDDDEAADRAAAMLGTRWQTILPDVRAALAAATEKKVIERLQRVAAELEKGKYRTVQFGGVGAGLCTNLMYLADGGMAVTAHAVKKEAGDQDRPGVILVRPGGKVEVLFDPDVVASMQAGPTVPLEQADGKVWLPGTAHAPACLVDLAAGRIVARIPEWSYCGLHAVTPGGTVFAAMDSFPSLKAAFTPGKPDPRPVLLADDITAQRGSAIGGIIVASDGAIFGVQRNRGLCSFDGREWRAIAAADPNVSGVIWSCVGTDGAVLVRFDRGYIDRGYGLRIDDAWTFAPDLRQLVERHRVAVTRCFRRTAGSDAIVADTAGNIWVLDNSRLTVLVADRWEDVTLALQAVGKAVNAGLQFLAGVGDGSRVYVSDLATKGLVGEVVAGVPRFTEGPFSDNRRLLWLGVREPGGALWIPATRNAPGPNKQYRVGQFPQRLTEAGVTHEVTDCGWPLLADAAGDVWFASGTKTPGMVDELIVWRDGAVKARVPFQAREEGLRLFAAGHGRVLAWTYLGLRLVTAQGEPEAGGYEVGPVMSVRSRGTPPLTMKPLLSLPIAVVEDQVMIVAEPGLRDDRCRLFITDLPAR